MPIFPMSRIVEVFAPATIANLGVGFDILGMAVADPYDTIRAERTETPGVVIVSITNDHDKLPRDAQKNTAGIAAQAVLNQLGIRDGEFALSIHKGLALESGMGSSAASAVGAAIAVNALYGNSLRREELLGACLEAEAAVSGRHADNVAPALLGGIVLITGLDSESIYKLPVPDNLVLALVTPAVAVPTAQARAVLPKTISLADMVQQTAAVGLLVTAIHRGDVALMARAMESDRVVEPAREHLMPGLHEIREAAARVGALATVISGAGPTLCAVCDSTNVAHLVVEAMHAVYVTLDIAATTQIASPSRDGATLRVVEP